MSDVASQERVVEAETARGAAAPAADREDRARKSSYSRRFAVIYVVLALVTGVAVGALIVEALRDPAPTETTPDRRRHSSRRQSPASSAPCRSPTRSSATTGCRTVTSSSTSSRAATRSRTGIWAISTCRYQIIRPADGTKDKDSLLVQPDDAIQYSLCGAGQSCAIPGTASTDRGILVRRMGLELALRTMKFDPSVDNVTVFLGPIPPPAGVDGVVLMYRRNVLENQNPGILSQPISRTLPGSGRRIEPGLMPADVARRVDQLTRSNLYYGVYQLIGGRDALLQLQPFPKG